MFRVQKWIFMMLITNSSCLLSSSFLFSFFFFSLSLSIYLSLYLTDSYSIGKVRLLPRQVSSQKSKRSSNRTTIYNVLFCIQALFIHRVYRKFFFSLIILKSSHSLSKWENSKQKNLQFKKKKKIYIGSFSFFLKSF